MTSVMILLIIPQFVCISDHHLVILIYIYIYICQLFLNKVGKIIQWQKRKIIKTK